ncbi:MAG: OmpA family protein [Phycisphaerae bacterium]|nr:OmpA family protein [Phycisphaerae bacterium]
MAKKEKKAPEGAPDWMVTYGDMMTLLFCFFVILVSMSETKQDKKFARVIESIKTAFGYKGGINWIPADITPSNSNVKMMQEIIINKYNDSPGKTKSQGTDGVNDTNENIRPGVIVTDGLVFFDEKSVALRADQKLDLRDFAVELRGRDNKIYLRGHAVPSDKSKHYSDLFDLTFARAMVVKNYMVNECGIRESRITVEACGANEPRRSQAYLEKIKKKNRLVEIIESSKSFKVYGVVDAEDVPGDFGSD